MGDLPREIQEQVRRGEIAAHAAMRYLVPLARANLDYEEWHNFLGNKGLVTALLSRLRHHCHT